MSDGLTDASRMAERNAIAFAEKSFPNMTRIKHWAHAPKRGAVLVIYEEWLDHIVEVIEDRLLKARYVATPFGGVRHLPIGPDDWTPGYYQEHRLKEKKDGS